MLDHQRFLNQDLVLNVSKSVNPAVFDINKYEGFLDALCGEREYQKTAIRNTLAYLEQECEMITKNDHDRNVIEEGI